MKGQQQSSSSSSMPPVLVFLLFVGIFCTFIVFLSRNPAFFIQTDLKFMMAETALFKDIYPSEYEQVSRMAKIIIGRDKDKLKNLNVSNARKLLALSTKKTRGTIAAIVLVVVVLPCSLTLLIHSKTTNRRYYSCNLGIPSSGREETANPTEAFIEIVGPYLNEDIKRMIREHPTDEKILKDAFELAKLKKNIPNNIVARMYPPQSKIRFALLEVGKNKKYEKPDDVDKSEGEEGG